MEPIISMRDAITSFEQAVAPDSKSNSKDISQIAASCLQSIQAEEYSIIGKSLFGRIFTRYKISRTKNKFNKLLNRQAEKFFLPEQVLKLWIKQGKPSEKALTNQFVQSLQAATSPGGIQKIFKSYKEMTGKQFSDILFGAMPKVRTNLDIKHIQALDQAILVYLDPNPKLTREPLIEDQYALQKAIEEKGISTLQYASEALKNDEGFLLELMDYFQEKGKDPLSVLPYADDKLKNGKDFVRTAIRRFGPQKEEAATEKEAAVEDLEKDYDLALKQIKKHGAEGLASVSERFRDNQAFLLKAMEELYKRGESPADLLAYVNQDLQSNPDFLIAMAKVLRNT